MSAPGFSPDLFVPTGRILLLGTSGYSLYKVIRGDVEFEMAIFGSVIGMLSLCLYMTGFDLLADVSEGLLRFLSGHVNMESLKEQILDAIRNSDSAAHGRLPDANEFFSQIWRAGLWGAISSLVELLFILADILIEVSQKVFLQLIVVFFPVGCGLFPQFPKVLTNLVLYAFELSLWRPISILVHEVTSVVGRQYMANDSTQGLRILAVEIIAVILILSIPTVTHKILSGALAGDFGASGGFLNAGKKIYGTVGAAVGGVFR